MKKLFIKITLIFTVAVVIFVSSACNFISKEKENNVNEKPDYYTEAALSSSLTDALNVQFGTGDHSVQYGGIDKVIEQTSVDRAVVTVLCQYGNYVSIGSGVIIDVDDGIDYGDMENNIFYIITCHHMVDEMATYQDNKIEIRMPDINGNNYNDANYQSGKYVFKGSLSHSQVIGNNYKTTPAVSLVGGDKSSDIAVLKLYVDSEEVADTVVKAKVMDKTYSLSLGESIFAVGNCQGEHPGWLSAGVVADKSLRANIEDIGLMTLIGIDVATSPGSSGGGLFNMYGELVGITNAGDVVEVVDVNGNLQTVAQRLNYAIPHFITETETEDNGFINVAGQLIGSYSESNFGYVSARKEKMGFTAVQAEDVFGHKYVYVSDISVSGKAYKAGLRKNDRITALSLNDGEFVALTELSILSDTLARAKSGDKFTMQASRNGTTVNVSCVLRQYLFNDTGVYPAV